MPIGQVRNRLEQAIALYFTTRRRLVTLARTQDIDYGDVLRLSNDSVRSLYLERRPLPPIQSTLLRPAVPWLLAALKDTVGLERVDAINYYSAMLEKLNDEVG